MSDLENGSSAVCSIKGCNDPALHGSLCVTHFRRMQNYGDPLATKMAAWRWLRLSHEERFWLQVRKGDGCWNWQGGKDADGYGAFHAEHDGVRYKRAHRYSYALHHKKIPFALHVCHTCDNPACVRPDHLFLGTNEENHLDKIAKGRARVPAGEKHWRAVLTEEQARAILGDPRPHSHIASEYGVHPGTISSLKTRVSWPHLGPTKGVKAKRVSPRKGVSDKITPEIVRAIRASHDRGIDLAARYGVTKATITDIRKRRSWAHIE